MKDSEKSVVFGYIACNGRVFYKQDTMVESQHLSELAYKLGYSVGSIEHVAYSAYRNFASRDVQVLLSKARLHRAEHPTDRIIFCFDNVRLVCWYLPEPVKAEMRQLGRIMDTIELEDAVFQLQDAELRSCACD